MKKTFDLNHPKIKYDRMVDAVKNDIRKYVKRERKRTLPDDTDFWDFDCKFGETEGVAKAVHLAEIDAHIDEVVAEKKTSFYVEIIATPGVRTKKKQEISPEAPRWVREMHSFASASTDEEESKDT